MDGHGVLEYLARDDKCYLGAGKALLFAPTFPQYLDTPGFWDELSYLDYTQYALYTVTLLDEQGRSVALKQTDRRWRPSEITSHYEAHQDLGGLLMKEVRAVLPDDAIVSRLTITNTSAEARSLRLVAWSAQTSSQDGFQQVAEVQPNTHGLTAHKRLTKLARHTPTEPIDLYMTLGVSAPVSSYAAVLSEPTAHLPRWELTPFPEYMDSGRLPCSCTLTGVHLDGLVYMGVHSDVVVAAGESVTVTVGCTLHASQDAALKALDRCMDADDPVTRAVDHWAQFFDQVPHFTCDDPYLTKYYWYRWYGLKLLTLDVERYNYRYPAVCEGLGYFRVPITYSAQCHMRETRWLPDPALAQGSLLNFAHHQTEAGHFPGHIYAMGLHTRGFYHANWGDATLEVDRIHPDETFLTRAYESLVRYAEYFDRERDRENSGLYDIIDQYETGQEYMSRYLFVDPQADAYGWVNGIRLKGVDATVYMYELKRSLAEMAKRLGIDEDVSKWQQGAEKIRQAVLEKMWDPKTEMFFDVDPATMQRSSAKAAVCFYPFFTDIAGPKHLGAIYKHLLNPDEFWTEYPVPSTSVGDPYFDPQAHWKGKRTNCPWNGRTWPMTNSHIAEALVHAAENLDPQLTQAAVEIVTKFVRMMFFDGDVDRPNSFEHYNPYTARPSAYRGVDDYQHSWVVDLLIKYVAGVRPQSGDQLVIKPLPFGLDRFRIERVHYKGREITVSWHAGHADVGQSGDGETQEQAITYSGYNGRPVSPGLHVYVDGNLAASRPDLGPLTIDLTQFAQRVSSVN